MVQIPRRLGLAAHYTATAASRGAKGLDQSQETILGHLNTVSNDWLVSLTPLAKEIERRAGGLQ